MLTDTQVRIDIFAEARQEVSRDSHHVVRYLGNDMFLTL
jgi:hypothetical protein